MGLDVYWLQLAEDKLDDIYSYYKIKAGKRLAQKLIIEIVDNTIHLKNQPKIGQVELNLTNRKQEFRYLLCKNYKIIYWINLNCKRIEIANIFDCRQDPEKIKETK